MCLLIIASPHLLDLVLAQVQHVELLEEKLQPRGRREPCVVDAVAGEVELLETVDLSGEVLNPRQPVRLDVEAPELLEVVQVADLRRRALRLR